MCLSVAEIWHKIRLDVENADAMFWFTTSTGITPDVLPSITLYKVDIYLQIYYILSERFQRFRICHSYFDTTNRYGATRQNVIGSVTVL